MEWYIIPVHDGSESGRDYSQWGSSGKKYFWDENGGRDGARRKAHIQGSASESSGYNKELKKWLNKK